MTTPARLRYEKPDGTMETIGTFLPQSISDGNIGTFTIEETANGYNRVIIEGEPELQGRLPVTKDEFGTSEREILVEVDKNRDGNFTRRMRVYPKQAGNTNDDGRYKNKNLWGFKKETGQDDVSITTAIDTDIVDVLNEATPSNYNVVYPSDRTPPSVNEFTYTGSRQQLYSDIRREYNHYIIFTGKLDGNGNDEILLQPEGYGDVQFSLTRGQEPMVYDYFKPRDTSNIVSKVQVIGTTPSNVGINETFRAGSSNDPDVTAISSLPEPEADRFVRHKTDSLGGTKTEAKDQAEEIAKSILEPETKTNLALDTELRVDSNLNQSVGIIDDDRQVDTDGNTLDDVFTVVKQKDFLHEGITYLSFEFEQKSTEEQRDAWRQHSQERANIFPTTEANIGNQSIDDSTDTDSISINKTSGAEAEATPDDDAKELRRDPSTNVFNYTVNEKVTATDSFSDTRNVSSSGWSYMGAVSPDSSKPVQIGYFTLTSTDNTSIDLDILVTNDDESTIIHHSGVVKPFENDAEDALSGFIGSNFASIQWRDASDEYDTYKVFLASKGSNSADIGYSMSTVDLTHNHEDDIEIEDGDGTSKPDMVKSTNPSANITSDAVYEEDGSHFHTIDVTTKEDIRQLFQQNKTDK